MRRGGGVSLKTLETAAFFYLQRYSSSAERLRRVLRRRVARAVMIGQADLDAETAAGWIEAIIDRLRRAGVLDDARHAETRAVSLRRRGDSQALIARRLRAEGVDGDIIRATLDALAGDAPGADPDLSAAMALARRRGLGPYRADPGERAARRDRDLAALARKGFPARVARAVIDAPDVAALDAHVGARDTG